MIHPIHTISYEKAYFSTCIFTSMIVTFGYERCSFSLTELYLGLHSYSSRQKRESICPSHYFGGKEEQVRGRWRVFSIFGWYNNPKEVQLAEKWVKGLVFISGGLHFPWYKEKSTLLTFYTAGRMKQALFPWYLRDLISSEENETHTCD